MSAKDIFHNTVRLALEKHGWVITDDPLFISIKGVNVFIDLGAMNMLGAEKDGQQIAVEIKSFLGKSDIAEFHLALGQFLNYRSALRIINSDKILYLAIPKNVYEDFFSREFIKYVVAEHQLKLLIFDTISEEIVLWKK